MRSRLVRWLRALVAPGPRLTLVGALSEVHKIEAIKEVRRVSGWGLKAAKETVDAVLTGHTRTIPLVTDERAEAVAQRLVALGLVVEVNGRRVAPPAGWVPRVSWADRQRGEVEVRSAASGAGVLCVEGRMVSGEVGRGDDLGLPIHSSLMFTLPVERVERQGDTVRIEATATAEDVELWVQMGVVGDVLPVLRSETA